MVVMHMYDPSLTAEIHHFHSASAHKCALKQQIDCLEGELFMIGMRKIHQIAAANVKAQIKAKQDEEANVQVVLPWEHMKDTLHMDNLDNGF